MQFIYENLLPIILIHGAKNATHACLRQRIVFVEFFLDALRSSLSLAPQNYPPPFHSRPSFPSSFLHFLPTLSTLPFFSPSIYVYLYLSIFLYFVYTHISTYLSTSVSNYPSARAPSIVPDMMRRSKCFWASGLTTQRLNRYLLLTSASWGSSVGVLRHFWKYVSYFLCLYIFYT